MRLVFKQLKNRMRSDSGDAILVMSVLLVPFFFICAGFALDLTKAAWVKQQFQTIAQEATYVGARDIETTGAIKETGPQAAVNSYVAKFAGAKADSGEGTFGVRNSRCKTVNVNGVEQPAPYIELTLDGGRNNPSVPARKYISKGGAPVVPQQSDPYNISFKYYSLSAKVWDTAPNLIMGMFGKPCQQVMSSVSSINFGSQEDLDQFIDQPVGPEVEDIYNFFTPDEISGKVIVCNMNKANNTITWSNTAGGYMDFGIWYGASKDLITWQIEPTSPAVFNHSFNGALPTKAFIAWGADGSNNPVTVACVNKTTDDTTGCTPYAQLAGKVSRTYDGSNLGGLSLWGVALEFSNTGWTNFGQPSDAITNGAVCVNGVVQRDPGHMTSVGKFVEHKTTGEVFRIVAPQPYCNANHTSTTSSDQIWKGVVSNPPSGTSYYKLWYQGRVHDGAGSEFWNGSGYFKNGTTNDVTFNTYGSNVNVKGTMNTYPKEDWTWKVHFFNSSNAKIGEANCTWTNP